MALELELKCPNCGRKRKFIPRNKNNLRNKRLTCFFCGKNFKVREGL